MLILTYFTARSNCATLSFKWLTVTMIDTLEIIASSDLEFGLLSKLNNYVSPLQGSGDILFFPLRLSVCLSVCVSVCLSVRHKIVSAL